MYYSDTSKLAHAWANQSCENGKTGAAIYFEGPIIYSYGAHFPIAQYIKDREGDMILYTLNLPMTLIVTVNLISTIINSIK